MSLPSGCWQSTTIPSDLSYILIGANTHRLIASRWDQIAEPAPVGSLVKPFIALAYGQKHNFRYPTYFCHGTADGCWLPRGHGKVDIRTAIAYSCDAYFLFVSGREPSTCSNQ